MHTSLLITFIAVLALTISGQGATVTSLGATISTNVDSTVVDDSITDYLGGGGSLSTPFEVSQELDFNGNGKDGVIVSNAAAISISTPDGGGTFLATGVDIARTGFLPDDRGAVPISGNIDVESFSEQKITFSLGASETRLARLNFDYSIFIDNGSQNGRSGVYWSLDGPSGNIAALSGLILEEALSVDRQNESVLPQETILTEQGTYVLTLRASAPDQSVQTSKKEVLSIITNLQFEVTNIPEPSTSSLLIATVFSLLARRKR